MFDYEKKEFVISLNNFRFNAGVIGFLKVLEFANILDIDDLKNGSILRLPFSVIENFETYYIKALVNEYKDFFQFKDLVDSYNSLLYNCNDVFLKKKILDILKEFKKESYLAVFSFIPNAPFNISESDDVKERRNRAKKIISEIKKDMKPLETTKITDKDKNQLINDLHERYTPLIEKIVEYKDDFYMKMIMYNIIDTYWENKAFLSKTNCNNPIKEEYYREFVLPVIKAIKHPPKKDNYRCLECNTVLETKKTEDVNNFRWITGMGVDSGRKTSIFWNFNRDDIMCPLCSLIYSCMPLGFSIIKSGVYASLFINNNSSIKALWKTNVTLKNRLTDKTETISYKNIFATYLKTFYEENKDFHFLGLQIIQKKQNCNFMIDIITKNQIDIFANNESSLKSIGNNRVTLNKKEKIFLYDEVVKKILTGESLSFLISLIIKQYLRDSSFHPYYLMDILKIQNYVKLKRRGGTFVDKKENEKKLWMMKMVGSELRSKVSFNEINNKLKGYIYRLEEAVRANDSNHFISEVIKLHMQYEVIIPASIINILSDKDTFKDMAHAYIIGLFNN